jgi:hypothetical protein
MAIFPDSEWQASQVRLTMFPTLDSTSRRPEWWQETTGAEPNESTADRKRKTSLVSGEFAAGILTLGLSPDRIDWFLTATNVVEPTAEPIGPYRDTLDNFSKLAERWLSADVPDAMRMAFGLVLQHPEADHKAGYQRLPEYVPVRLEPDWRDFLFQINTPAPLTPDEYGVTYLNRLSRWSVMVLGTGRLLFAGQRIVSGSANPGEYSLRLELDISTPAESLEPLPRAKLVPLYRELVSAAQIIAQNGVAYEQYRLK